MIPFWYAVCLMLGPATVGYVSLTVTAALLVGSIPLQLHLDTRRSWIAETDTWHSPGLEVLPAPRRDLAEAWPMPLTPMDLPARWDTEGLALAADRGRHRLGEAPGTVTQQARWNTPTGQFWLIVAQMNALDEPCSHCATPEDGERPHAGCPGCSCPCSDPPALPAGVEGHSIGAGRTR